MCILVFKFKQNSQEPQLVDALFAVSNDSRCKSFKVLMATIVSSQISANSKAECQSSAANDDHQHHDEDPEDIELDLGSAYWDGVV